MRLSGEQRISHAYSATRRRFRLRRPLGVKILGTAYATEDWSTSGLKISHFSARTYIGEILIVSVSIPDADSEITFEQKTRVVRHEKAKAQIALKFVGLGDRQRALLQQLSECLITGTIDTTNSPLNKRRKPADLRTGENAQAKTPLRKSRFKSILKSTTYTVACLTLCALVGKVLYTNLFRIQVDAAPGYVSRTKLTAHSSGFISAIFAAPGGHVVKGDTIIRLENFKLRDELVSARKRLNNMIENAIKHEIILNLEETKLREDPKRSIQNQTGSYAISEEQSYPDKILIRNLNRLSVKQRSIRKQLSSETMKLRNLLQQLRKLTLRAPVTGRIIEILKSKGSRVIPAEPLIVMEGHNNRMLEALLTHSEANNVGLGQKGMVNSPEQDLRYPAKVIKIEKIFPIENNASSRREGWGKIGQKSFRVILKVNDIGERHYSDFVSPGEPISVSLQKSTSHELIQRILSGK